MRILGRDKSQIELHDIIASIRHDWSPRAKE